METVATASPCRGTLTMRPFKRRATLSYDLVTEDDAGHALSLHGEKHVSLSSPVSGMTTLHTTVEREGRVFARGTLRFDLRDLVPWLTSFRNLELGANISAVDDDTEPGYVPAQDVGTRWRLSTGS